MATRGTINPAVAHANARLGDRLLVLPYTDVDNAETVTLAVPITEVAWKGTTTADTMTVAHSGRVVTFSHSGGAVGHDGNLYVWYGGAG